ncbi:type IV pili methyl-accepting chemotaxis transducer N-terminal domain-containing protein [Quatrionicoccus australiensis]|uniref:type IV pili methyl-accepting chemotaxis transducer N-terminal domain-containing protein n=1 Tax=Quatrionicoccus australiensis TaxID=138118 RepID=UPI001CF8CD9D|nr:type IV pili methyl-accepting chemotaxis transducer N-terminal domain-containing protein [Quatrionicoccus australiensis]UCV14458.1 type IV pili methyl-accepting chemotaxis transducer N-terminal domain-containing protein [Quatrionicoccus australiensis]
MLSEGMRRRSFILGALSSLVARPLFAAEGSAMSLGAAINKAGRQRMLSQRMAKAFTMLVLGAMPQKAEVLLEQSRRLFESQLVELASIAPGEAIKGGLLDLERAWAAYRDVLGRPRTPENLRLVLAESDRTLRAAHQLTGLYEKQAGSTAGHLVNISGRQRMLSQRMAKCFLVEQSGIVSEALRGELDAARRDFVAALKELNQAPENTPEIRIELELANTQWLFFEQALNGRETRELAVRNVATTSERILEVMDGLTGRYEKLVRG